MHLQGILANAAAYLNVDSAVSGPLLRVKATPSLAGLINGALGDIEDPATGKTLLEAWSGDLLMLGSGSDYAGKTMVCRSYVFFHRVRYLAMQIRHRSRLLDAGHFFLGLFST